MKQRRELAMIGPNGEFTKSVGGILGTLSNIKKRKRNG